MTATCPWCSAPRDPGPTCPRCGAIYAKAEAIKAHGRAVPGVDAAPIQHVDVDSADENNTGESPDEWGAAYDPELELKFRLAAIPVALCFAVAFHASGLGASLQRIFLTMPVHEFGHAVTAWFCGFSAVPTLWKTIIPETRGFIAPLVLLAALGYMMHHARMTNVPSLLYTGGALILLQAIATFGIGAESAQILITFGGDGAGMIIATLLMGSFFFGRKTQLYKGSLRWGFVVMGAAAFVDIYATWLKARNDDGAVPYGTTGGMASDSMMLVDVYGWSMQSLIHRYVVLGVCCLIVLALVYAWGIWRTKSEIEVRRLDLRKAAWKTRQQEGS